MYQRVITFYSKELKELYDFEAFMNQVEPFQAS
jgi:hypothetical protein